MINITSYEELYDFYKDIPNNKWCLRRFNAGNGQHCAFGHLGCKSSLSDLHRDTLRFLDYDYNTDFIIYANDGLSFTYYYRGGPLYKIF